MYYEIEEYTDDRGKSPFAEWFKDLDPTTAARIMACINRMEIGNFGDSKFVGRGVRELRLHFGPGFRVYYSQSGDRLVLLLGGGSKHRQQADIENAQIRWADYQRKKA